MYAAGMTPKPQKPGSPYLTGIAGCSSSQLFSAKYPNDHMLDHNGERGIITPQTQNFIFPGVAQLVGRQLWELEAARSNRATRTKSRGSVFRTFIENRASFFATLKAKAFWGPSL